MGRSATTCRSCGQAFADELLCRRFDRLPRADNRNRAANARRLFRRTAGSGDRPERTDRCAQRGVSQCRKRQCPRLLRHPCADGDPSDRAAGAGFAGARRASARQRPRCHPRLHARPGDRMPHRACDVAEPLSPGLAHHRDLRSVRRRRRQRQASGAQARADGLGARHCGDASGRLVRMPRHAGKKRRRRQCRAQRLVVGAIGGEGFHRAGRPAHGRAGLLSCA